jgi:AraC-like DNA-binding protein
MIPAGVSKFLWPNGFDRSFEIGTTFVILAGICEGFFQILTKDCIRNFPGLKNALTPIAGHSLPPHVQVLRDRQIISGFIYEDPVTELPSVTHCGEALCCRGHTRPPHCHEGFEFLYLSRGTAYWQAAGRSYIQGMRDIFIARPHELHSTGPNPNPENLHIWLGLRLENFGPAGERLARQIRQADIRILPDCQDVEPLLRAIIGQVVTMRRQRAQVVRALIDSFIAMLEQRLAYAQDPAYWSVRALPYSPTVLKALAYMKQHLDHRLPLRDLAQVASARSVPHFCAQFHREVGVTPAAYHVLMRLEAAREMLKQPAFDITAIALHSGFSSSQHFSTLFKRAFGVTPRIWKKNPVSQQPLRMAVCG